MNDSSAPRRPNQLGAIKNAISSGTLDAQAIHDALLAEVSSELDKPIKEVDMDYVNACEELLALLNRDRAASAESHYYSNLRVIQRKLKYRICLFPHFHQTLRIGTIFCLFVLLLFGGVFLSVDRLKITMSPDGEQLVVQGIPPQEDALSLADGFSNENAPHESFDTTDYEEAVKLFGVQPHILQWLPEGWEVILYSVDQLTAYKRFTISYQHTQGHILTFTEKYYADISLLRLELEQNDPGNQLIINDKLSVYFSQNYDMVTAQWQMDHSLCTLYGVISKDDIFRCIQSIAP